MAAIERIRETDAWKLEAQEIQQRLSAEWLSRPSDETQTIMAQLERIAQPSIEAYVVENDLGHVRNASPEQMNDLVARIENTTGITEDNARLAVLYQRMDGNESEQYERRTPQQDTEDMQYEYLLDVIRGKDGPAVMRDWDQYHEATRRAEPLLRQYAAEHRTGGVEYIGGPERDKIAAQVARDGNISYEIAQMGVLNAFTYAQEERNRREWQKFVQAVGEPMAENFLWKQESGTIQSYWHMETGKYLHLDGQGQFYNQDREPITREAALERVLDLPRAQQETQTVAAQTEPRQVAPSEVSPGF